MAIRTKVDLEATIISKKSFLKRHIDLEKELNSMAQNNIAWLGLHDPEASKTVYEVKGGAAKMTLLDMAIKAKLPSLVSQLGGFGIKIITDEKGNIVDISKEIERIKNSGEDVGYVLCSDMYGKLTKMVNGILSRSGFDGDAYDATANPEGTINELSKRLDMIKGYDEIQGEYIKIRDQYVSLEEKYNRLKEMYDAVETKEHECSRRYEVCEESLVNYKENCNVHGEL